MQRMVRAHVHLSKSDNRSTDQDILENKRGHGNCKYEEWTKSFSILHSVKLLFILRWWHKQTAEL